jgi:hypothetical protein
MSPSVGIASKSISVAIYVPIPRVWLNPVHHCSLEARWAATKLARRTSGYDRVAELFFESAATLHRDLLDRAAPAAGLALLEDEKRFIDLARSPLFTCTERSIIEPG